MHVWENDLTEVDKIVECNQNMKELFILRNKQLKKIVWEYKSG